MINAQILKLSWAKELVFVAVFTGLAVAVPLLFHIVGGASAGKMFLPMNFIVLAGALIFGKAELSSGWRVGLAAGFFAPLISYSLAGMPILTILPFILIEISIAGFFAGWLAEKKFNIYISLIGAIAVSKILTSVAIWILPTNLLAIKYILGVIEAGWIGLLAQVAILPIVVKAVHNFLNTERS